jgi:hypothetical protein
MTKKDAEDRLRDIAAGLRKLDEKEGEQLAIAQKLKELKDGLDRKELRLAEKEQELANALKAAEAEHARWEAKNAQLTELQNKFKNL